MTPARPLARASAALATRPRRARRIPRLSGSRFTAPRLALPAWGWLTATAAFGAKHHPPLAHTESDHAAGPAALARTRSRPAPRGTHPNAAAMVPRHRQIWRSLWRVSAPAQRDP